MNAVFKLGCVWRFEDIFSGAKCEFLIHDVGFSLGVEKVLTSSSSLLVFLFCAAYYADLCVGSIACRLEKKEGGAGVRLYIMTLGVLAPYRRIGIGKSRHSLIFETSFFLTIT